MRVTSTAATTSYAPPGTSVERGTPVSDAAPESARIDVLDILRGIALLGMFFVHFSDSAQPATAGFGAIYHRIVELFFEERFWTMFGILFGAGFAIQLRSADRRGDAFTPRYLRRLVALVGFG